MIGIKQLGPVGDADSAGEHTYEVRINKQFITTFTHFRSDGLSECLRRASIAVDESREANMNTQMMRLFWSGS